MSSHRGVTLIELLVVLAVLAIMAAVVGLTVRPARAIRDVDAVHVQAAQARDSAVRSGHAVTITLTSDSQTVALTALPDGRVVADKRLAVDPLSGGSNATP